MATQSEKFLIVQTQWLQQAAVLEDCQWVVVLALFEHCLLQIEGQSGMIHELWSPENEHTLAQNFTHQISTNHNIIHNNSRKHISQLSLYMTSILTFAQVQSSNPLHLRRGEMFHTTAWLGPFNQKNLSVRADHLIQAVCASAQSTGQAEGIFGLPGSCMGSI